MNNVDIAQVCHEANRAYCQTIGDDSQPSWANAPDWQKNSAIAGVNACLDNQAQTPEMTHAGWSACKIADGWKLGPVEDSAKKEHPCLVPYPELPASQRLKDSLFIAVVQALLER